MRMIYPINIKKGTAESTKLLIELYKVTPTQLPLFARNSKPIMATAVKVRPIFNPRNKNKNKKNKRINKFKLKDIKQSPFFNNISNVKCQVLIKSHFFRINPD